MKICSKCKAEKPDTDFYKDPRVKIGLQSSCKACHSLSKSVYRLENKEKIAEIKADYYLANKEKVLARSAAHRHAEPVKVAEYMAAYYKKNKDKAASRSADYRLANSVKLAEFDAARYRDNPERYAGYRRNRRARVRNADGTHTAADIRTIFASQHGLCANCRIKLVKSGANKYHVDHIMPLALGGSNWPANLQCLCPACNLSKGAKHPDDWAKLNGKLL